jgi:hypothetical protein
MNVVWSEASRAEDRGTCRGSRASRNHGFTARELNVIRRIIEAHRIIILEAWHEHCG